MYEVLHMLSYPGGGGRYLGWGVGTFDGGVGIFTGGLWGVGTLDGAGVGTLHGGVGTLDRGGGRVGTLNGGGRYLGLEVGTLDGEGGRYLRVPPPVWTDRRMDGQTRVKTLPSRRTTYAVGNNKNAY